MKAIIILGTLFLSIQLHTQAIYEHERYVSETDPQVLSKLEKWQDLKFGLLMHWGAYSQWGIVESWSLCPEDYGWCQRRKGESPQNYYEYKKEYEDLQRTFNPIFFNPEKWAHAAREAGMKYVVFTTKHHDGFCMFDSKYTNYKVTDNNCPFSINPKSNITLEIFDAFRNEGLWTGAYFSKPDWHHQQYWDPYFPPQDRNVNYDPKIYPEKWNKYVEFTHNQILELATDYGPLDILWLDGGWVQKMSGEGVKEAYAQKHQEGGEAGFIKHRIVSQDIRMDELVQKVRNKQPGLIVVDRAVYGKNQNYLTPENRVPEKALPYPWESCIISGGGWSYTPDAKYMNGREAIHLLVDIVSKGGNLLLNIAPGPDGTWQQGAYDLLEVYSNWMNINGEGIYNSRPVEPYKEGNICTTKKNDGTRYFFYLLEGEGDSLPKEVIVPFYDPGENAKISILGNPSDLNWNKLERGFMVEIPDSIGKNLQSKHAITFKVIPY